MKKRWLGILLALCLLVCFAPAALAAEKAGVPYREVCEETMRAYHAGKRKGQADNE